MADPPYASPMSSFKHKVVPGGVEIQGWFIHVTNKQPILTSWELEEFQKAVQLEKIPDMIFGKNKLTFTNVEKQFQLVINPFDAIQQIERHHDSNLKVSHHENWAKGKNLHEILEKKYDWTFSTKYRGTIVLPADRPHSAEIGVPVRTQEQIDINKLKTQDPILFYDEVLLYEDELGDNGDSNLSVRVRVMPTLFFALLRFWLRVDHVIYRVYETRIYHEFGKNYFLREFQHKEGPYEPLKKFFEKEPAKLHDPNIIAAMLPLKEMFTEKVQFF